MKHTADTIYMHAYSWCLCCATDFAMTVYYSCHQEETVYTWLTANWFHVGSTSHAACKNMANVYNTMIHLHGPWYTEMVTLHKIILFPTETSSQKSSSHIYSCAVLYVCNEGMPIHIPEALLLIIIMAKTPQHPYSIAICCDTHPQFVIQ